MRRVIFGLICVFPLLLSGCGPKPPETFLNEYFSALIFDRDRDAALALIQLPAGIAPPPDSLGCFVAEERWIAAIDALQQAHPAADRQARRRLWLTWKRDKWIGWKRQHTTRTTATIRVRVEGALFAAAKVEPASTIELDYVLIRRDDQTWRINKVEASNWQPGQEFTIGQPQPAGAK